MLVILGGGLGSASRYLISLGSSRIFGDSFPFGTLAANLAGCFLIGLIMGYADRVMVARELRLFMVTGFLGGLTTFSTFSLESMRFLSGGAGFKGLLNLALTIGLGLALTAVGLGIGMRE